MSTEKLGKLKISKMAQEADFLRGFKPAAFQKIDSFGLRHRPFAIICAECGATTLSSTR
jgi:hypothetical protein